MSLLTYLDPNAIKDASIEGIKIKNGAISSSKIDETVASKNYVDAQVKAVDDKTVALEAKVTNAVQITYSELKSLRDSGKLIPGTQYRITDYTCTTTEADTQSAGHQFDIIVIADKANKLNCKARAIQHEGDTYFNTSQLEKWELWYDIENNKDKYYWADTANGKGVIYRMIDEYFNDCPYDFKNIQFKYDYDIFGECYFYTFSYFIPSTAYDYSIIGNDGTIKNGNNIPGVYHNIIKPFYFNSRHITQRLNMIEFIALVNSFGSCIYNTIGNNCQYIAFGDNCNYNTFGNDCETITFGYDCVGNTFSDRCKNITFGNGCAGNTLDTDCKNIVIGNDCSYNTFGKDCEIIFFADNRTNIADYNYYQYNHFGNGCKGILFKGTQTASDSQQVQNYNIAQGLEGDVDNYDDLIIDAVRGRNFETKVGRNSSGEVKQYCIEDLIL